MNLEVFKGLLKPVLPLIKFFGRQNRIEELESLCSFVSSRSSYVAQVSLYGYLKARAGTRYVSLIKDPLFASSMKRARDRIFFACLMDLTLHVLKTISTKKTGFSYFGYSCPTIIFSNFAHDNWGSFWKPETWESHPGVREALDEKWLVRYWWYQRNLFWKPVSIAGMGSGGGRIQDSGRGNRLEFHPFQMAEGLPGIWKTDRFWKIQIEEDSDLRVRKQEISEGS